MVINDLKAFQILDSRGNFTTQVIFICSHGEFKASCPSGASVGFKEAVEIRDADKSVKSVCENINANIKKLICGKNFSTIKEFDDFLLKIDGTTNKSNLGANCTLPLSIAFTRAIAALNKLPIYEYIRKIYNFNSSIPIPMINLINGGCHANNKLSIQEFMIVPNTTSYKESIEVAVKVFTCLKIILTQQNKSLSLGDEGGYCAFFENTHDALDTLVLAIKKSGYLDTKIALDVAANELLLSDGHYLLDNKKYSSKELVHFYEEIILKYPIISIEDGLSESDFSGWNYMTSKLNKTKLVGDDIFASNVKYFSEGVAKNYGNAILIKPNQVGTITETINTILVAKKFNKDFVPSHRSGDTEDDFICDLAVATGAKYIKIGSVARGERTSKHNKILTIEQMTEI